MSRWTNLNIVGGAYTDDATPWSKQDCVNYLPVMAERAGTRSPAMLRQAPGCSVFSVLPAGAPVRGLHDAEGLLLGVSGSTLYTVDALGNPTSRGTIPGVGRVSIAHNQITGGNEIAIANGLSGYVYNTKTAALTQITDSGFIGAKVFDFVDGYLVWVEPGGRFWGWSDLANATSYNTLDRSEAEAQPDRIVTLKVSHREVAVFGERSTEFYRNVGTATGTFQRIDGTELEIGCPSTFGVAKLDNTLFFIGHDGSGYALQGYQPVRITTHAIEQAWSRCDLSSAYCYTFEDRGHKVWYVTFTDGQTWGYDVATKEWHRRKSEGLDFWRMADLIRWNRVWIAGDYANGKLYQLDWRLNAEAGATMERRRTFPVMHDHGNRLIVNALRLDFDTGLNSESPPLPQLVVGELAITGAVGDGDSGDTETGSYALSGGVLPRTVTITSGTFPAGLTLASDGSWSGSRTDPGTYSWTVTVTDADGNTATLDDTSTTARSIVYEIQQDTPILYWQLNELSGTTAADSSGNGRTGTYSGSYTQSADGVTFTALSGAVSRSFPSGVAVGTTNDWAIEATVTLSAGTQGSVQPYVATVLNNATFGYENAFLQIVSGTNKPSAGFTESVGLTDFAASDPNALVVGQKTHLMIARRPNPGSTIILELSRNGVVVATYGVANPDTVAAVVEGLGFHVGGGTSGVPSAYGLLAKVAHVAVYDAAPSQARILAHAQALGLA